MERTTKKQRAENARQFYQVFKNLEHNRACIVVERNDSGRTQFKTVPSNVSEMKPIIIAESLGLGIDGCWIEFISNIYNGRQTTYYEDNFKQWLKEIIGIEITYFDGYVFIIER